MRSLASNSILNANSFYFYFGSFTGLFTYFTGYFWRSLKRKYKLTGSTTV